MGGDGAPPKIVQPRRPSGPTTISENIWQQLLPNINLRTLYRCQTVFKECNRAVGRALVWRPLIARDLGLLPSFITNLKLYYLREMNFGVPLPYYRLKGDRPELYNRGGQHLDAEEELALYVSPLLVIKQGNIVKMERQWSEPKQLPKRITIKRWVTAGGFDRHSRVDTPFLLSTEGELYSTDGSIKTLEPSIPPKEVIRNINVSWKNYP